MSGNSKLSNIVNQRWKKMSPKITLFQTKQKTPHFTLQIFAMILFNIFTFHFSSCGTILWQRLKFSSEQQIFSFFQAKYLKMKCIKLGPSSKMEIWGTV